MVQIKKQLLTTKLVFPIWQSPTRQIFKLTKSESESESYPLTVVARLLSCPVPDSSIAWSMDGEEFRRGKRRYPIGLPIEQTRILSHMNLKNSWKTDTLPSTLHLMLRRTIFRQSCVIFPVDLCNFEPWKYCMVSLISSHRISWRGYVFCSSK